MRILVVGGAGYIGSHVTKSLLEAGHQPVVVDNLQTGKAENLLPGVPFVHADLRIPETLQGVLNGCEGLVHLAALKAAGDSMTQPEKYANQNISGTIQLLNAATESGVRFVIFSSTAAVYGNPQYTPMDEEHPTEPSNFYGYTKLAIEELLGWYEQLKGIRYASLRYFNAAGYDLDGKIKGLESEPNNLLPIVMEAVIGKRPYVEVFGTDYETRDGSCIRDYIHVNDLADGHVRALEYLTRETNNPILNLGTSKGISVLEILEHTKNLSHTNFDVRFGSRRLGDPAIVLATAAKAKSLLGWEAKRSDPKTLINSMLNVYKAAR